MTGTDHNSEEKPIPSRILSFVVCCGVVATAATAFAAAPKAKTKKAANAAVSVEPLDAPAVDAFAGRTVRDRKDGIGLIKARSGNVPKVGEPAPTFALKTADGKRTLRLAELCRDLPVVLIFGSHT